MIIQSVLLRLAIIGVLCLACLGSGFVAGVQWESNKRDAAELKRVKDVEIKIRTIVEERERVVTKYVNRIVKIYVDRDRIMSEVDQHAQTIPDPRECWLAPERVRVINDAIGAAGERSGAAVVPAPAPAPVGESPGRGEVGGGHGPTLPGVFRSAGDGGWGLEVTR